LGLVINEIVFLTNKTIIAQSVSGARHALFDMFDVGHFLTKETLEYTKADVKGNSQIGEHTRNFFCYFWHIKGS